MPIYIIEQPNPQMVVSRIDLKHVMNTYTNFRPSNNNNNFDQNSNKPNYALNFGSQYTPQQNSPQNTMNSYNKGMTTPTYTMVQRPVLSMRTTTAKPPSYAIQSVSVSNTDLYTICGTRYSESEVTPFIFGGEETQRGDWPWTVAIYLNKATGMFFQIITQ